MSDTPEIHKIRDAEVRVFDRDDGTDDASDMYVMEALGVTVRIRFVRQPGMAHDRPKVVVETEEYPLDAEVCGVESTYGDDGE